MRAWQRTPRIIRSIGYVGTVAAAIYAVFQVVPILEPGIPAHRAYARSVSHDDVAPLLKRIVEIQLAQNEARRKRLLNSVKDHELEMQSPAASHAPQYRALIQENIDRSKHELKDIDEEDTNLFKEKK